MPASFCFSLLEDGQFIYGQTVNLIANLDTTISDSSGIGGDKITVYRGSDSFERQVFAHLHRNQTRFLLETVNSFGSIYHVDFATFPQCERIGKAVISLFQDRQARSNYNPIFQFLNNIFHKRLPPKNNF